LRFRNIGQGEKESSQFSRSGSAQGILFPRNSVCEREGEGEVVRGRRRGIGGESISIASDRGGTEKGGAVTSPLGRGVWLKKKGDTGAVILTRGKEGSSDDMRGRGFSENRRAKRGGISIKNRST